MRRGMIFVSVEIASGISIAGGGQIGFQGR
jgi:hypothetical protein